MIDFLGVLRNIFGNAWAFYDSIDLGGFTAWEWLVVCFVAGLAVKLFMSSVSISGSGIRSGLSNAASDYVSRGRSDFNNTFKNEG